MASSLQVASVVVEGNQYPTGVRFQPNNREVIDYLRKKKTMNNAFVTSLIREVDLSKFEPWDLLPNAKVGEELFVYSKLHRKYLRGSKMNRATKAGYWKPTGKPKVIKENGVNIGMMKIHVFYRQRALTREKTDWIMHEYKLQESHVPNSEDEWVICKVFLKRTPKIGTSADASTDEIFSPPQEGALLDLPNHTNILDPDFDVDKFFNDYEFPVMMDDAEVSVMAPNEDIDYLKIGDVA